MSQIVTDPSGHEHEFPDEATPEMISQALGLKPTAQAKPVRKPTIEQAWENTPGLIGDIGRALYGGSEALMHGVSFGGSDELNAARDASVDAMMKGEDIGQAYDQNLEAHRTSQEAFAERNPKTAMALNLLGAVGSMGGAGGVTAGTARTVAPASVGGVVGRSATAGAGMGATSGFLSGEGGLENRGLGAAIGGATGALVGAALPIAGNLIGRAKNAVLGSKSTGPNSAQLKAQSGASYAASEAQGIVIPAQQVDSLVDKITNKMAKKRLNERLHPETFGVLEEIQKAKGKDLSLEDLDVLRQFALDASKSPKAGDQRLANKIIDKIDDFVDNNLTADNLKKARELWSRARKSQAIEDALEGAEISANKSGSGGNIDNATRNKLAALLTNKQTGRYWTTEERALLKDINKGGGIQALFRVVGKLDPGGNGLMAALQTGAAMYSGGTTAPLMLVGMGSKRISDKMTGVNTERLLELVRTGQIPPRAIAQMPPQLQGVIRGITTGASNQIPQAINTRQRQP